MRATARPVATLAIAGLTAAVSALQMLLTQGDELAIRAGFLPARWSGMAIQDALVPAFLTPLSSALLHGGFVHLALNMLVFLFVGTKVERVIGSAGMVLLYLVGAYASAAAQWLADPHGVIPMVGASGAISAVFGTYSLMFGQPKAVTRSWKVNRAIHALWLLAAWVVIQWMNEQLMAGQGYALATAAHIGGFVAGLALQRPLLLWRYRGA